MFDLTHLAEMKWRYRVVGKGESPASKAIELLERANDLIERHEERVCEGTEGLDPDAFRAAWAAELSEVLQGLGVTRLIFNKSRDEDDLIGSLLAEALELRQASTPSVRARPRRVRVCVMACRRPSCAWARRRRSTLSAPSIRSRSATPRLRNCIGARSRRATPDRRMCIYPLLTVRDGRQVRRGLGEGDDGGRTKAQSVAQSLVSLGNLAIEVAEDAAARDQRDEANEHYGVALGHMREAKEAYTRGYHEGHPKVAWATEGLGKIYAKQGNLAEALEHYAKAAKLWHSLQSKGVRRTVVVLLPQFSCSPMACA